MILKKEIERKAVAHQVSRSTIDKDWALGHFIDAIFSIEECRKGLVFKGGTCLKKCYIEHYRFSEDLDFTAVHPGFILRKELLDEVVNLVQSRTEMPLYVDKLTELRHKNELTGYAAIIKFWGADHARDQAPPAPDRWTTSIKIEIITYEKMVFPATLRSVFHEYSDQLSTAADAVPCYDIREVLAEKIRALVQRSYTAPRDYYDIWYLANNIPALDWEGIVSAFHEKMFFKGLEFKGVEQLINPGSEKAVKAAWQNSLSHQIMPEKLPDYNQVKNDLYNLFNKII